MSTVLDLLNNTLREEIVDGINESLPDYAPNFDQIITTSVGVKPGDKSNIGRGWKIEHLFKTGISGIIQSAHPFGPTITATTGSQVGLVTPGTGAANLAIFPNPIANPWPMVLKRELYLQMVTGVYSIPSIWLTADALDATIVKQVGMTIQGVAVNHAMREASSFFSYRNTAASTYKVQVLGRIATAGIAEYSTTDAIDLTIDESYGTIHNFRPGMMVDVVADSSGTLQDGVATDGTDVRNYAASNVYIRLYVTSVDYISKKVRVFGVNSSTGAQVTSLTVSAYALDWGSGQSMAVGDWIVPANCSTYVSGTRPMFSWGFEDWMASSGTILSGTANDQALDLDLYPQFKSRVVQANQPLTETFLAKHITGYVNDYPGAAIDTMITTPGVTRNYAEQGSLNPARFVYERQGKPINYVGGWSKVGFSLDGKMYNWVQTPLCLKSRMYAHNAVGNIFRYAPPKVGGSQSEMGGDVEFIAPVLGYPGIFMPALSSSAEVQVLSQAPFYQYVTVIPKDVRGIKIYDITEADLSGA